MLCVGVALLMKKRKNNCCIPGIPGIPSGNPASSRATGLARLASSTTFWHSRTGKAGCNVVPPRILVVVYAFLLFAFLHINRQPYSLLQTPPHSVIPELKSGCNVVPSRVYWWYILSFCFFTY